MKDVYYFSHDANARRDPKMQALRSKYGSNGYGIYFMLIEILSEQHGYKIEKFPMLYDGLAKDMWETSEALKDVISYMINDCHLLRENETHIWSESLIRRKAIQEQKRQIKVEAGRVGGIKSGETRKTKHFVNENEAETKQNEALLEATNQSKVKESKVEERKGKSVFVKPTLQEVVAFCKEIGGTVNGEKFFYSNEAKGWLVGKTKTPMKNWKAAVRTWEHSEYNQPPLKSNPRPIVEPSNAYKPYDINDPKGWEPLK